MSLISDAKDVVKLAHEAGNLSLYQRLVELQGEIVEISGRVMELETENRSLKEALDLKARMTFKKPFYYQEGDEVPFCPNCWESSRKAIHVADSVSGHRCNACGSIYSDRARTGAVRRRPYGGQF
jgi:hypothetical protein